MTQTWCFVAIPVIINTYIVDSDKQDTLYQAQSVGRLIRIRGEQVSFQCEVVGEGDRQ